MFIDHGKDLVFLVLGTIADHRDCLSRNHILNFAKGDFSILFYQVTWSNWTKWPASCFRQVSYTDTVLRQKGRKHSETPPPPKYNTYTQLLELCYIPSAFIHFPAWYAHEEEWGNYFVWQNTGGGGISAGSFYPCHYCHLLSPKCHLFFLLPWPDLAQPITHTPAFLPSLRLLPF